MAIEGGSGSSARHRAKPTVGLVRTFRARQGRIEEGRRDRQESY